MAWCVEAKTAFVWPARAVSFVIHHETAKYRCISRSRVPKGCTATLSAKFKSPPTPNQAVALLTGAVAYLCTSPIQPPR